MISRRIKLKAVEVRTEFGVCPGRAKMQQGETFTLGAPTPEGTGICANALGAKYPISLAMRLTDKMKWETKDYFEMMGRHDGVTYHISRVRETGVSDG
jgi:hypothetical protein